MRITEIAKHGLCMMILASSYGAYAQTTAQPMQIERVPLIQIKIGQEPITQTEKPAPKSSKTTKGPATPSAKSAASAAGTPKSAAKPKVAAAKKPQTKTLTLKEESRTQETIVSQPEPQYGNSSVTTITNNNITYNITNHVTQSATPAQQSTPAVTLSITPEPSTEVTPLPPRQGKASPAAPAPMTDAPAQAPQVIDTPPVPDAPAASDAAPETMPPADDAEMQTQPLLPPEDPMPMPGMEQDPAAPLPDSDLPPLEEGQFETNAAPLPETRTHRSQALRQVRAAPSFGPGKRFPALRVAAPAKVHINDNVKKKTAPTNTRPVATSSGTPMNKPYALWIKTTKGTGKRPVVITLPGCGGLYSTIQGEQSRLTPRYETMIRVFNSAGFHVLLPDIFTPKGKHGNCPESLDTWEKTAKVDRAFVEGALDWLSSQDNVDMAKVVLFGWSYGATVILESLNLAYQDVAVRNFQPKAAVGFYPYCQPFINDDVPYKPSSPIFIVMGENDNWTLPKYCQRLSKRLTGTEATITMKLYPNTYHDFDAPSTPLYVRSDIEAGDGKPGGVTAGGNPESRADAYKEILRFIHDRLQ